MKRRHWVKRSILPACFCLLLFMGCAEIKVPKNIVAELEDKSNIIVLGKTNRETVHEILGEPIISNSFWKIDIFRHSAKQSNIILLFLIPKLESQLFLILFGTE